MTELTRLRVLLAGPLTTDALRGSTGLLLAGAPPGTAPTPIPQLAGELFRLGHEVHVLTLDPAVTSPHTIREAGMTVTFCPLRAPPRYRTRMRSLDLFRAEIQYLQNAMRESGADLIHAHWTYEYAEAAVRSGSPALVTMHDLGWEVFFQFRDAYRFMRLIMKYRVMPRIQHLTVVSPFMKSKASRYGYFGTIDVVPNGLKLSPVDLASRKDRLQKPIIVTVGNASRLKNVKASVDAFTDLARSFPGAELHLFGPGLDEAYASGHQGVVGHGSVSQPDLMQFLLEKATVMIHPALVESFGMVIAEAKAAGIPVVAGSASGGVPFVCGLEAGCRLRDVRDPGQIAGAVMEIMSDPVTYQSHVLAARQDIERRFDIAQVAQQYVSVYTSVLRTQASGR